MSKELSTQAQNAYAELWENVTAMAISNATLGLHGSFSTKKIKDKSYWYFQYRDISGKVQQVYIGPDDARIGSLIERHKVSASAEVNIQKMARSAIALGCDKMLPKHYRAIRRLAEYGFFSSGGILVGTHAFLAMGNMLGLELHEHIQTQDVDLAHPGKNISIALNNNFKIDAHKAIESLEIGLLPIAGAKGKFGATYLNPASPDFRIDFLTSRNSDSDDPVYIDDLAIALQPLKFMEFSMRDPVQAMAISEEGATLVNIPRPENYAIHKLIISGERPLTESLKAKKDIRQANLLISHYIAHREDELKEAWQRAYNSGPGWRQRLQKGLGALKRMNANSADFLSSVSVDNID